jgi:cytoskeletal protein CcmA (bactofilin family)
LFGKERTFAPFEGKIENVLGPSASFEGHLKTEGNVRVDGYFNGAIETSGNVIIGEAAKVTADITANNVQVWGALKGKITAQGRLEILPTGRVWGDISVTSLLIDEGGVFRGDHVTIGDQHEEAFPEPPLDAAAAMGGDSQETNSR